MKIIFGVLVMFGLASNNCLAQLGQPIPVSVLKEGKKIDDLMNIILKEEKASGDVDKSLLKDSCWMVEMLKWNDNYISFQIVRNSKSVMNFRINGFEHQKANYGYFSFKGNRVFVWTKDDFGNFFSRTNANQTFNFLFYSNDTKASEDELYPNILHYQFKNGHFSIEGPPATVKQAEN